MRSEKHRASTQNNYHTIWSNFNKFLIKLDKMPKTWEDRVALYCTHLVKTVKVQSSTLKSYVSAIKDVLITDGYDWKFDKVLFSTITASCKSKNDRILNRFPIQVNFLEVFLCELERKFRELNQIYLEILYKNLFLLAYYGMFRIGELTTGSHPIKAKDIHSADNKDKIMILLYSSKTHGKESRPQSVKIERNASYKAKLKDKKKYFCPFQSSREYLAIRGNYINESDPYFIFSDNSPVKPSHARAVFKSILIRLNLNPKNYGTHSFRIGRATDLLKRGCPIEKIKQLGRWRSNAVYKYLRNF